MPRKILIQRRNWSGKSAKTSGYASPPGDVFAASCALFDVTSYAGVQVAEVRGFDAAKHIGDKGLRNNDRLTRLYLVAARLGLEHAGLKSKGAWTAYGPDDVGVSAANAYGSLEAIHELNLVAKLEDPRYINPARFPNTVINASLGYVSIWEDLRAFNATVVNGPAGALDSIGCAEMYLSARRAKAALVGGAEALSEPLVLALHRSGVAPPARVGEGAAFALVEPLGAAKERGATVYATVTGYGTSFEPPADDDRLFAPSQGALERAVKMALEDAAVSASQIDLVMSGCSGWASMDAVERAGLEASVGARPTRDVKARTGETLGASGAFALAAAVAELAAGVGETALIPSLGFYGNASALVVRRAER